MSPFTTRPVIIGRHGVVTSGHYLATAAGLRIIDQGGNAIDAAAAFNKKITDVVEIFAEILTFQKM